MFPVSAYYMAPEVWRGNFDRSADLWATGVITFLLLFGFLPFYDDHARKHRGPSRRVIRHLVERGFHPEVRYGCGPWFPARVQASEEARSFVASLLKTKISERISASEALAHRWLRGAANKDTLPEVVMRGLSQFASALDSNRGLALLVSNCAAEQMESADSSAVAARVCFLRFECDRFDALLRRRKLRHKN